jgi:hypothetical protein
MIWLSKQPCLENEENELYRGLHPTRRRCADHLAEGGAIDIAVHGCRSVELGVVEGVESLETELQRFGLVERNAIEQCHVKVIDARPGKKRRLALPGWP